MISVTDGDQGLKFKCDPDLPLENDISYLFHS